MKNNRNPAAGSPPKVSHAGGTDKAANSPALSEPIKGPVGDWLRKSQIELEAHQWVRASMEELEMPKQDFGPFAYSTQAQTKPKPKRIGLAVTICITLFALLIL